MDRHLIEQHREPLIGLQYITEYKANNGMVYWCNMCEINCASVHMLIGHICGRIHRTNYMQRHYPSYLQAVQSSDNEAALLIEYSRIIEQAEGRQSIVSNTALDISTFLQYTGMAPTTAIAALAKQPGSAGNTAAVDTKEEAKQSVITQNAGDSSAPILSTPSEDDRNPFDGTSATELLHKLAMRSGYKSVSELLKPHMKHLITNEDEANKALEAANFLTKAVLNYRLTS